MDMFLIKKKNSALIFMIKQMFFLFGTGVEKSPANIYVIFDQML